MENKNTDKIKVLLLIVSGALSGAVNGFFGGGGGMIVVPLLVCACNFLRKEAHATAVCVMLPVCVISAIVYAVNGNVDLKVVIPVTSGFTAGGVLGAFLLKKIDDKWLKWVFSALIAAAGVKLLFFS